MEHRHSVVSTVAVTLKGIVYPVLMGARKDCCDIIAPPSMMEELSPAHLGVVLPLQVVSWADNMFWAGPMKVVAA